MMLVLAIVTAEGLVLVADNLELVADGFGGHFPQEATKLFDVAGCGLGVSGGSDRVNVLVRQINRLKFPPDADVGVAARAIRDCCQAEWAGFTETQDYEHVELLLAGYARYETASRAEVYHLNSRRNFDLEAPGRPIYWIGLWAHAAHFAALLPGDVVANLSRKNAERFGAFLVLESSRGVVQIGKNINLALVTEAGFQPTDSTRATADAHKLGRELRALMLRHLRPT